MRLTTDSHDRDAAGMRYVYPVVSRRARGVSVGVNLNPNNACNWRCVYCQVPDLEFGMGPPIELDVLRAELDRMLGMIQESDYIQRHVPEGSRRLNDIAFSGNGEPTSSPHFRESIAVVRELLEKRELLGRIPVVLITNGSLAHKAEVRAGLDELAQAGGQVWFKFDSATAEGQARINSNSAGIERTRKNLRSAAELCPTWLQTIQFARNGNEPAPAELDAWLAFVREELEVGTKLAGVLLYGLARQSHQPEAPELSPLPADWLEAFAERIRALGLEVRVSP